MMTHFLFLSHMLKWYKIKSFGTKPGSNMKKYFFIALVAFASFSFAKDNNTQPTKGEPSYFVEMWQEQNAPVILVKEENFGEWKLNSPYFFRRGFSGDGDTKLTIGKIILSTSKSYKPNTLVLVERRSDEPKDAKPSNCPYWLIRISSSTPAVPLTKDGTAIYVYGEDTFIFNGSVLLTLSKQLHGIWKDMANEISKQTSNM